MNTLILILVALCIIGIVLWGISKVLVVVAIPEPFRTILWVVVVIIAMFVFLDLSGLYHLPAR